jgi:phosphoribosyl 1,2-cyclic phosphate phosphodiesterase
MGGAMPLYGWPRVLDRIKRDYHYAFATERYPGVPSFQLNEFIDRDVAIAGIPFRTFEVMHAKLPVLAFVLGNFCYITDANFIDTKYLDEISGIDTLIINALQIEAHISHFTLAEALAIIDRVKPKRAILTHISHNLGTHFERSKELPAGVELAYDGLSFDLAIS